MSNHSYVETRVVLKFAPDERTREEKAFVALDYSSGGYPYAARNLLYAHDFQTVEKATVYAKHFQTYPLKIQPTPICICISVSEISSGELS